MKKIRVTYFALAALVSAASCTREAADPGDYDWADGEIYFKTSLADVVSRADDMTLEHLESFQVTCFNTGDTKDVTKGFLYPYFEDATFVRQSGPFGITYVSSPEEGPRDWPANAGQIRFFAFSPSRDVMSAGNPDITDDNRRSFFSLVNSSTYSGRSCSVSYRMGKVRIKTDIADQFDFLTAEATGNRWLDFSKGVDLAFHHQLAQVELKAWGAPADIKFEIAGVRIGNPAIEGTFIFADDAASGQSAPRWKVADNAPGNKVEYLYRGADYSEGTGDRIYCISQQEHNTPATAASLMGRGGCAMVIPTVNQKWEGLGDPLTGEPDYSTERMYFSILMRISYANDDRQIYPYPRPAYKMNLVHYAVDRSGLIVSRVYPGEAEGQYFTDSSLSLPYTVPDGVEIRQYGWAAVPVDADWSAGKRYIYTLDYSEGIGIHDPEDPEPGKPIIGKETINWGVSVGAWNYATEDDDYQPDVNVPPAPVN